MTHPKEISCLTPGWRGVVIQALSDIQEIDLIHFLFSDDIEFCQDVASQHAVDFNATPRLHVAFFRKRIPPKVCKVIP